tara:strand:- start:77 stop:274 length:198 start_codon:yes stop_codon:yes gene_type:complete
VVLVYSQAKTIGIANSFTNQPTNQPTNRMMLADWIAAGLWLINIQRDHASKAMLHLTVPKRNASR